MKKTLLLSKKMNRTESQIVEENLLEEKSFLEEEITLISEDLELTEDTVIQNRQVVFGYGSN